MADQVKPEGSFTQNANQLSYKSEKNTPRPRGSGSPFKCIGLGLAQQVKSENVEELTAAKLQIAELESLVVSKQKEVPSASDIFNGSSSFKLSRHYMCAIILNLCPLQIFSLNAKLAGAESMTHDVIRDLLGVKLDMTSYAVI